MVSVYDEDYYLTHDLNKNSNSYGVPFLTLSSDLARDTGNNIIYGHNIRINERDVFADLVFYEDIDFYKKHPLIKLVTDKTAWESESDYLNYMAEVDKRNWLETDIPCGMNDKYLTLSSCSVELAHSGTNRMVVMARKLKPDEDYNLYLESSTKRNSPLLPGKLR